MDIKQCLRLSSSVCLCVCVLCVFYLADCAVVFSCWQANCQQYSLSILPVSLRHHHCLCCRCCRCNTQPSRNRIFHKHVTRNSSILVISYIVVAYKNTLKASRQSKISLIYNTPILQQCLLSNRQQCQSQTQYHIYTMVNWETTLREVLKLRLLRLMWSNTISIMQSCNLINHSTANKVQQYIWIKPYYDSMKQWVW